MVVLDDYLTALVSLSLSLISDYLCKPEDNIYSIDFTRFKIRDLETGTVLFEIAKPCVSGRPQYCSSHFKRSLRLEFVCTIASCGMDSSVSTSLPPPEAWAARCSGLQLR